MSPDRLDTYREAIIRQQQSPDGLVLVRINDLRALLDCWQWFESDRPRIRRAARTEAAE